LPTSFDPAFVALAAGLVVTTVVDIRTRRIPNELTAGLTGIGLGLAAAGISGITLGGSVLGLALGLALMMPGHLVGATGAGDVKLMAGVGAIVGPATVFNAFLFTAVAGGVLAIAVALWRRRLAETLVGTSRLIAAPGAAPAELRMAGRSSRFAYGPAIAIGSLAAVLVG
jgi:prepilin peptidase CpaA